MRIHLRPAEEKDCRLIWKWRNDKTTRRYSFDIKSIPLRVHQDWFRKALKSNGTKIVMIEDKTRKALGVVRFDINLVEEQAKININIAPDARGKGIGTASLKLACLDAFRDLKTKAILARIKKGNSASRKAFLKAGFSPREDKKIIIMRLSRRKYCGYVRRRKN